MAKIILLSVKKQFLDHTLTKKLFFIANYGFKNKTSCNHAIFVLKETILHHTENKSGCKAASLDAEKAFAKT